MSNRSALRHTRKAAAAMIIAVAALGLTACQDSEADTSSSSSSSSPSASAPQSPTAKTPDDSANTTPSGTPKKSDGRCTDQINYAGDPRSNAEINTIGEETGHCPKPQKADTPSGTPSGTPKNARRDAAQTRSTTRATPAQRRNQHHRREDRLLPAGPAPVSPIVARTPVRPHPESPAAGSPRPPADRVTTPRGCEDTTGP